MKKAITTIVFSIICIYIQAQVFSPNIGVKWDLDSLVYYSGGVVSKVGNEYHVNDSITLMPNDTFEVLTNEVIKVADDAVIEILGVALLTPPDSIVITAQDTNLKFPFIRLENSGTVFHKTQIIHGGGLGVYNSSPVITNCQFKKNESSTRGAINLFNSNAIIVNSKFYDNYSSAISGGANIANAPLIINNHIARNVTYNGNKSQIVLGSTGNDTAIIAGNHIEGLHDNAGAISVLPIGNAYVIIDNNIIENNRYGIGMLSGGITSVISNNIIKNNDIQRNPLLGGSGLNFGGGSTNTAVVFQNEIYGNLWGVTIQNTAKPNLGDLRSGSYNIGQNEIYDNFNSAYGTLEEYAIFNNTPDSIWAENNIWRQSDSTGVESIISHKNDDPTLGFVSYMPVNLITSISKDIENEMKFNIYPNPANEYFTFDASKMNQDIKLSIFDIAGKQIMNNRINSGEIKTIDISELSSGVYFVQYFEHYRSVTKKLIVK